MLYLTASENYILKTIKTCFFQELRDQLLWNSNPSTNSFYQENTFGNVVFKRASISSQPQCVKKIDGPSGLFSWVTESLLLSRWPFVLFAWLGRAFSDRQDEHSSDFVKWKSSNGLKSCYIWNCWTPSISIYSLFLKSDWHDCNIVWVPVKFSTNQTTQKDDFMPWLTDKHRFQSSKLFRLATRIPRLYGADISGVKRTCGTQRPVSMESQSPWQSQWVTDTNDLPNTPRRRLWKMWRMVTHCLTFEATIWMHQNNFLPEKQTHL